MIKIIDSTLCMLNDYKLTKEQINCFISFIGNVGIKDLQINPSIYNILEGELPEGFIYYLEMGTIPYICGDYPIDERIKYYFTPKRSTIPNEIETHQLNDISEPTDFKPDDRLIKITGLDSLLISGCDVAVSWINKKIPVKTTILCPENTYSCATATALLFLEQKGYAVVTSFSGIGNKAATEQVIMALHVSERYMNNREFSDFSKLKTWLEEITAGVVRIPPSAPIIGERIFHVESGVHVDGILKKPANYEPYPPEEVGLKRKVVLGKYSGKTSVIIKLKKLGLKGYSDEDVEKLLKIIKIQSISNGTAVSDNDFIKIVKGYDRYEKDIKNC